MSENKGYLYRIMRFDHAVQALNGKLYFAHPSQWEDPYETHIKHQYDHAIFAQCWTTASMSDAMWRIYSPGFLGVRLRTTKSALATAMRAYAAGNPNFKRRIRNVDYLNPKSYKEKVAQIEVLMSDDEFKSPTFAADLLCLKRSAFSHEREVRAILYDAEAPRDEAQKRKGIEVEVNGHALFDSILLDPRAPKELCEAMQHYFKKVLRFEGKVGQSKLYTVSGD